jgi:hypothetical protein
MPIEFDTDMDRIRANRELGRVNRAIGAARTFFVTLAVVSGLWLAISLLAFFGSAPRDRPAAFVPCVLGGLFAVYLSGSLRIRREPMLWSLVGALLMTLMAILSLGIIPIVLAAGCWAAVAVVAPLPRLLRQHPDLRIAAKIRGEKRPARGRRR